MKTRKGAKVYPLTNAQNLHYYRRLKKEVILRLQPVMMRLFATMM